MDSYYQLACIGIGVASGTVREGSSPRIQSHCHPPDSGCSWCSYATGPVAGDGCFPILAGTISSDGVPGV